MDFNLWIAQQRYDLSLYINFVVITISQESIYRGAYIVMWRKQNKEFWEIPNRWRLREQERKLRMKRQREENSESQEGTNVLRDDVPQLSADRKIWRMLRNKIKPPISSKIIGMVAWSHCSFCFFIIIYDTVWIFTESYSGRNSSTFWILWATYLNISQATVCLTRKKLVLKKLYFPHTTVF